MNKAVNVLKRVMGASARWEYTWLCVLVLVTLALRFSVDLIPDKPIYDEVFYVEDARSILAGHGTLRAEHPPLGKLFVVAGISLFGDGPMGWRFFSIVFGTAGIILFYLVCRQLAMSRRASFLATFLFAFENMSFVQASIAMLDVYCVTLMLASFWLYLKGKYPLAGIMVGLSALAKLNGALALVPIGLHWLLTRRDRPHVFFPSMALSAVAFVGLMPLFDYIPFGKLVSPIGRIKDMLSLSGSLTFANVDNPNALKPWFWIFQIRPIAYWYKPDYIGTMSYTVLAFIIPAAIYMLVKTFRRSDAGLFGFAWFAGTYLIWIPATFIINRVGYPFYIYPTIPAFCLGLGMGLSQLFDVWQVRATGKLRWVALVFAIAFLVLHLGFFAIMSPDSYWLGSPFFK